MRVVGVFPHPDDEAWAAGGLLARAVMADADVAIVCATRGEKGTNRSGVVGDMGQIREAELRASAHALGITDVSFLDLPDGGLETSSIVFDARVLGADVVLALGDDGGYGHRDHVALTRALRAQVDKPMWLTTYPEGMFEPFRAALEKRRPGLCVADPLGTHASEFDVALTEVERARKLAAIACHRSQIAGGDPMRFLSADLMPFFLERELWYYAR